MNGQENVRRFVDLGVEVMLTANDLADNFSSFFSPDQMERFINSNHFSIARIGVLTFSSLLSN
jgi:hypothetical protein